MKQKMKDDKKKLEEARTKAAQKGPMGKALRASFLLSQQKNYRWRRRN